MKKQGIKFHEDIQDEREIQTWNPKGGTMVLDDLMDECGNDKLVLDLFTKHSHFKNVSIICCKTSFPTEDTSNPSRDVH